MTIIEKTNYGFTTSPSTPTQVNVTARTATTLLPSMGINTFFDIELYDGYTYRALSTVTDIRTDNSSMSESLVQGVVANDFDGVGAHSQDRRSITMNIEAVWKRRTGSDDNWTQGGGALPTSPPTNTEVHLLNPDSVQEVLGDLLNECAYVGSYRDLSGAPLPMRIQGFNSRRGATHQAIIGRSGSGKTALAHTWFFAQMRNEQHAVVVIDPQGQWSSERGFLFSLQKAAKALGRDVKVLRVSEDIRLPRSTELMAHMMDEMRLWKHLTRMGDENAAAFSHEVAKITVKSLKDESQDSELSSRGLLKTAFTQIARSESIRGRIYSRTGDAGQAFYELLCFITGEPLFDKNGEERVPSDEDVADAQSSFEEVLKVFTPLVNLFMRKNLSGAPRQPLSGPRGFLKDIMSVRSASDIAPYVVLDMSADAANSAIAQYSQRTNNDEELTELAQMREVLDNTDVKAHIVSSVLSQIVRQGEEIFNNGDGLLDTQIVFDEAWRYAPRDASERSAVGQLSSRLAGWALDTRKYGIGWTYILQSPRDLNETIWQQLTYIHVGHGITGANRRYLDSLVNEQGKLNIYDQFADPSSTNVYPFMTIGPADPLIFTATPTFFNVFSSVGDLLDANKTWLDAICDRHGKPRFSGNPGVISTSESAGRERRSARVPRTVNAPSVAAPTTVEAPKNRGPQPF